MGTPTIKYLVADPTLGVVAYSQSGTWATSANVYPPVPFGAVVRFKDNQTGSTNAGGALAVMCQGSNVVSAGQFVQVVSNSAILLNSANSASFYPIGIAGAPMSATNVYGFVGVAGLFDNGAFTNVSFAADARVALASTAGQIGSVTALGSGIRGIILPVSFTSSQTYLTVQLSNPFIVGVTASN
jgi:hypothetical protein